MFKAFADTKPRVNPLLIEGFGSHEVKTLDLYLANYLKGLSAHWPKQCKFLGCRVATPEETFNKSGEANKKTVEVTRSTMTTIVFKFQLGEDEVIERPTTIPYLLPNSEYLMNSARWFVAPVIADSILTVSKDVFVRLETSRLTFLNDQFEYVCNGNFENSSITHGKIHNGAATSNGTRAKHTIVHYLLAKYGFAETFNKYVGHVPIYGNSLEITPEKYPVEEWCICKNTRYVAPVSKAGGFTPSDIVFAIPRSQYSDAMKVFIANTLYIVSLFNDITPEIFESLNTWRATLGVVVFGKGSAPLRLVQNISAHISSIDVYLDPVSKLRLEKIGIYCENFYDLLATVAINYQSWLYSGNKDMYERYGKSISTLRWVALPWIQAFNRLTMDLRQLELRGRVINFSIFQQLLRRHINVKLIYDLTKTHGEFIGVQFSGDMGLHGYSVTCTPQREVHKKSGGGKGRINPNSPEFAYNPSCMVTFNSMGMSKAKPFGDTRLNPFIKTKDGCIEKPMHLIDTLNYLDHMLSRPFMLAENMELQEIDGDIVPEEEGE